MKKPTTFICISGKAQHGKDTSAQIFHRELTSMGNKAIIIHYADLLKFICRTYFDWNGEKDDYGRSLLQEVGTDVIRAKEPDFWVNWVVKIIDLFPDRWDYVIIPDCRFPNEINVLERKFINQTYHFRVKRPDFESPLSLEQQNHISETALDGFAPDELILNTTMENLESFIKLICKEYFS